MTKAGFVSLIGRPNAGKSTLMNSLLGEKIAMVSQKANATRRRSNAIVMYEDTQIIFVDTPGLHEREKILNQFMLDEIYEKVYRGSVSTDSADTPSQKVPPLTDRVYALHEVVNVDLKLPGCPTTPELVVEALTALLEGRKIKLPEKSVCDECPTIRKKKAVAD